MPMWDDASAAKLQSMGIRPEEMSALLMELVRLHRNHLPQKKMLFIAGYDPKTREYRVSVDYNEERFGLRVNADRVDFDLGRFPLELLTPRDEDGIAP